MNNEKKVKIVAECKEGICPICGGKLSYDDSDRNAGVHLWECEDCGATGKEGFNVPENGGEYDTEFDGNHYDVALENGTPVEIISPDHPDAAAILAGLKVNAVCMKSGICPICGGELEYGDVDHSGGGTSIAWVCCECGATGEEGREEIFNGEHYDVRDAVGHPVELVVTENTPEPEEGLCPFCGSEYRITNVEDTYEDEKMYWICDHCGASGKALYHSERTFAGFEDVEDHNGMVMGFNEPTHRQTPKALDQYSDYGNQQEPPNVNTPPCNEPSQCTSTPTDGSCGGSAAIETTTSEDVEPSIFFDQILDLIDAHRCHDGIKTNDDDEILVKGSQAKVDAIADFLDCLGLDVVTGYYDPKEDASFGAFGSYSGYRYIRVNGQ